MITKEDLIALLVSVRPSLDDNTALKFKDMYPEWKAGVTITQDMVDEGKNRFRYNDLLYRGVAHTTQSDWTPDITPSLWTVIDVTHEGTLEDPIPAVASMEYVKGKYYIEDGVIYLMNRDGMADGEAITLHYLPSQLVGQYFEIVTLE